MPDTHRIVIIGSGLGGLSAGVILAKQGFDVTVLEQGSQAGGCLQCFVRGGAKFETGMHFIGSAAPGQALDRLMRYLGISGRVRLDALDPGGYDVVALGGRTYRYATGRAAFVSQMAEYFPHDRADIGRYADLVERISAASTMHTLRDSGGDASLITEYSLRSVGEVMDSLIGNERLRHVLCGNLPLYAPRRYRTPFATHAFITDFYNRSAYRIVGGSDAVGRALVEQLQRHGGRVLLRHRAARIVCDASRATGVEAVAGGQTLFFPADTVISDIHPRRTLELADTPLLRPAFRRRISQMPQTSGCFTLYIEFKPDSLPYMNHNYYGYLTPTPWEGEDYTAEDWPRGFLYMHMCHEPAQRYARTAEVLAYMRMDELTPWLGTRTGRRGEAYEAFKKEKAARLLDAVERHFPGLRAHIRRVYTSTPLTYLDYTGTEGGSMYGCAKDVTLGVAGRVPYRTRVPNLLLTGQNIVSHGMLGVLVGSLITCGELTDSATLLRQIAEAGR